MSELMVLVGPQASGKSTWHRNEYPDRYLLSSDSWFRVDELGRRYWFDKEDGKCYYQDGLNARVLQTAWAWVWTQFAHRLQAGESFLFEGTLPTRISRSHIIHMAKGFEFEVIGVYFDTALADCIKRNGQRVDVIPDKAIARTFANMEPLGWDEGWDLIWKVPRYN